MKTIHLAFVIVLASISFSNFVRAQSTNILELNLEILPLNSSSSYPYPDVTEESPLILRFKFAPNMSHCPSDKLHPLYYRLQLNYLTYEIYVGNGRKFFEDKIDLYGQTGPGILETRPGINIPRGMTSLRIVAKLSHEGIP